MRGSLFVERDLLVFFIPPRQFWIEEVKNFIFPLWNPYYLNGHPLFATLQPGVLYPFSILFFILPFDWAFNLNIELHFALSGIFTYLLLRGMKASQAASIISAIAFMLSGYLLSTHNLLSTLLSVTWVPLFFLCYFSAIQNNRFDHAILSGLVGTFMFLGGGVEVCYQTFGITFFLTLFPKLVLLNDDFINIRRRLVFFFIFCVVFFGLSAVQLIPFLELSKLSVRSGGLSYLEAGIWSLHPFDLIEFFLPDQYGLATDYKKYWTYQSWLKSIYMGGIPFILALFFLKKWDLRAKGFLLLFFISLGLAMGSNTLFHHFLYDYLPFFNKLRYPVKFIFLAILILSVAAGLGYDSFKNEFANKDLKFQTTKDGVLLLAFLCMAAFGCLNFFNEPIVTYLKEIGWDSPEYNDTELNLFNFKRFLAFTSLFCLGLFLYSKPRFKNTFVLIVLVTIFLLDLFFANYKFFHTEKFQEVQKIGEISRFIQSDSEIFRVFVTPKTKKSKIKISNPGNGMNIIKEKLETGLLGNQQIFYVEGIAVTQQVRWKKITDLIKTAPAVDSTNLLNLMNVKYVLSAPTISSQDFKLVHPDEPFSEDSQVKEEEDAPSVLKIYENKKMLPRSFLVPQCKVINSTKEYKETMQSKRFDPQKFVLLDVEPKGFTCGNKEKIFNTSEPANIVSYKSNTVDILANTKDRQFLFLSDSYYPGWKAYVDGEETEIYRANYLFRAILIEPGEHKVRFEYDPLSFKLGLAVSMTTILVCVFYYFVIRNRRIQNKRTG